jgi:DEAD/DEAH box helicase domain-containing protein
MLDTEINYLTYDCEIIKCIPPKGGVLDSAYEYCSGWHDHIGMGIAVIGTYESYHDSLNFCVGDRAINPNADTDLQIFQQRLARADVIVGFNSRNFDDKLLAANGLNVVTHYDLLEEIRIAAFGSPRWQDTPHGRSYKLDAIAHANGMAKTGSGELAPQLWQQGKHQAVIEYCLHDVWITHELLKLGLEGRLIDPNTGVLLQLPPLAR